MISLVLIHGYPFDSGMWESVRARLPRTIRVICPDLAWVSGPAALAPEPNLDLLADQIAALIDDTAVVAGFSMGGYVALGLAERHPAKLSGFALVNSQTMADTEDIRAARRAMIGRLRSEGPGIAVQPAKMFAQPDEELVRHARQGAERAGVDGLAWALEAMARRPDRTQVFRSLTVPCLVVHSGEDQFVPVTRARELVALRPGTLYSEIPGAGHGTPLEAPQAVSDALLRLLDRVAKPEPVRSDAPRVR